MSILVGENTRLLVQGLGRDGSFQANRTREYGTNMVAAVHPGRDGTKFEDEVPYFSTVAKAVEDTGANTGVIFVPAPFAMDAIIEQVDAGLELVVCITEGVPVLDMVKVMSYIAYLALHRKPKSESFQAISFSRATSELCHVLAR
jgi:succinyl-CoA synthetase alpha subunit